MKMPQLAMAVRVLLLGTSQTPSLDAVIELFLRDGDRGGSDRPDSEVIIRGSEIDGAQQQRSVRKFGGYSSAGRALAWHARGQRFDPAYLHHQIFESGLARRFQN
jgi:hypothetical protein